MKVIAIGYIGENGKIELNCEYTEIERVNEIIDDDSVYLIAFKEGQAGLLKNKKTLLNYEYEDIRYNTYNEVFVIQRNSKQGVANKEGEILIQPEYENILFGGVYVNANKDGQLYILDINGNKIENTEIISKLPTEDGKYNIVVDKDEIYKIENAQGEILVDNNYSYIESMAEDYFIVALGNKNGIIDLSGKSVVDLNYSSIYKIEDTQLWQANISKTGTISLINKDMKIVVTMENASIDVKENYVKLYSDKEIKYFSKEGNEIQANEIFTDNKLFAKKINGKWGFVDANGEIKVNNEYDMVSEFNEYGFAGIKKDGKWGVINSNGEIIQEPVYKLEWEGPEFIGKFYKVKSWYGEPYYSNQIEE